MQKFQVIMSPRPGFPEVECGNFGCVYKFADGRKQHAVKCFTRNIRNLHLRYDAITRHFQGLAPRPGSLIDFKYLDTGIYVDGGVYPCVVMEWIPGDLLHRYVERNLAQQTVLKDLAKAWVTMVTELEDTQITHGDLQHGNIKVLNGQLKMIDYDGMYIPALRSYSPSETGHPNYRHPLRSQSDYGRSMDNFSALLIYVSILAVAADPSLWQKHHIKGENLIFTQDDLKDQNAGQDSPLWRRLFGSSDSEVKRLTQLLANYCRGSAGSVPPLRTMVSVPIHSVPMTPADWQNLMPNPQPLVPPVLPVMTPQDWRLLATHEVPAVRPSYSTTCSAGHVVIDPSEVYCVECARKGVRNVIGGYRSCPHCQKKIPERSAHCRRCGRATGWNAS